MRGVPVMLAGMILAAACTSQAPPRTSPSEMPLTLPSSPTALPLASPAQFQTLLASLRGTPVVVNVWASWCGPCVTEAPHLAAVSASYRGRVQFVGVDILDHVEPARSFIRQFGWGYPSVFDPTGAIRDDLGFVGQPVTIVFDRAGRQAEVFSGAITDTALRSALQKVL